MQSARVSFSQCVYMREKVVFNSVLKEKSFVNSHCKSACCKKIKEHAIEKCAC